MGADCVAAVGINVSVQTVSPSDAFH